jgi:CheY-like chemotaxis protein
MPTRGTAAQTAQTAQLAQTDLNPPDAPARSTVLYVEDNPANLVLVEELIARRPDLRLITAGHGTLGVELARAHLPQVILMDINLPGISGTEAMHTLRADPATAHIPVLALSAYALPADIEHALQDGFFSYLAKPIKLNEFLSALDSALDYSHCQSASAGTKA